MARAKIITEKIKADIVAHWRTGAYTVRSLADRFKVSHSLVGQLTKGVEKDVDNIVDKGVEYKQGLATLDRQTVDAVVSIVDDKVKAATFFDTVAVQNVQEAMLHKCESQQDYKARAETISKGRTDVLGKTPDTAIQINNQQTNNVVQVELVEA